MSSIPDVLSYGCTFYMPNDHTFKIMQSMANSDSDDVETRLVKKVWKRMEEDRGGARRKDFFLTRRIVHGIKSAQVLPAAS